jgi:pilus assembly protein FimV
MRCHSQALTIKLKKDVPLADIEQMIAADNEWVKVVPNTREATIRRPDAGGRDGHDDHPGGPPAQAGHRADDYLGAFTIGDQLLWGAAEPLRRMLRILLETLRAEIEVTSITAEERPRLRLRVAPPEAYRAAGVEYNAALAVRPSRCSGAPMVGPACGSTSDRAVTEPFVDVIIEATWASGRLVREYTVLLDPPSPRSQARPSPRPPPPAPAAATPAPPSPAAAASPRAGASPGTGALAARACLRWPRQPQSVDQVQVKPGDSLSRIAERVRRPGVSLDQMLVSLYRGNPQAFSGENMNRLKAGAVLNVPAADELRKLGAAEAREVIQAQSTDFAAYRQRLASGATAKADSGPARQAAGSVTAKVDDRKQGAGQAPDKLTLSQGAVKPTAPEAKLSKDAQRKDEATRVAELARNVEDLKQPAAERIGCQVACRPWACRPPRARQRNPLRPACLRCRPRSRRPRRLQRPAAAPAPAPAVVSCTGTRPFAGTGHAGATAGCTACPCAAPSRRGRICPCGQEGLAPANRLWRNPASSHRCSRTRWCSPGAGVLVALLVGLGIYRARARMRKAGGETSSLESRLQPDSFFGASGGQRVDTRDGAPASSSQASSSMSYSLSQLDAIGDVDPVAEADVYLAYGRDLQAEEILKEAMRANPQRMAIRTKLLEVYAKRRDIKGYELLATQVFSLTKGEGEDWAKVQEMGLQIDADNSLYQPGGQPAALQQGGDDAVEPLGASTLPHAALPSEPAFVPEPEADAGGLDLDLDIGAAAPSAVETTQALQTGVALRGDPGLDFDMTPPAPSPAHAAPAPAPGDSAGMLDFDLGDLSLDESTPKTSPLPQRQTDPSVDFGNFILPGDDDQSTISVQRTAAGAGAALATAGGTLSGEGDPLARKLELAEEFRQIGDLEGARDLLEEVVAKAEGTVRSKAQTMLNALA